jgi:hypothetical protein
MIVSKTLFAVIAALLTAMTARLVDDELRLRSIESNTAKIAKHFEDQDREVAKFYKDMDDAAKKDAAKGPIGWGADAAKTASKW